MLKITTLNDISSLSENYEVECKLASGKDGKGVLPVDFWKTYSAFANSYGGDVILGVRETKKGFRVIGIVESEKVLDDFWNMANNPQKVSANIVQQKYVKTIEIDGCKLIHIHVPRAQRKIQPVYINNNPMTGTYKCRNNGDYKCDTETVRRMLAEQVEESRDRSALD